MHFIIKNHACYNIMSVIASLIATYKHYALVSVKYESAITSLLEDDPTANQAEFCV